MYSIESKRLFLFRDFEVINVKNVKNGLCLEKCKMYYEIEYESSLIQNF